MKIENNMEDLFVLEKKVIERSRELIKGRTNEDNSLVNGFKALLKHYEKLLKQTSKIMEISDRNQTLLIRTQEKLEDANKKLARMSFVDSLTNIPNRRKFDDIINLEWSRAMRTNRPLSFIMMDIDHFKSYNDNYGHLMGDEVLKGAAQVISVSVSRSTDFVARYGGEEFVCVLPETDSAGAKKIAERIMDNLCKAAFPHAFSGVSGYITLSIGITSLGINDKRDIADFIKTADDALYKSKEAGRNRITIL